ncbi:HAD family phosphatase [Sphingobacterium sp. lm-10]|uniref:HAD family hydrolase n=1 Tax=Sphingobacterium sp. lm-10 TaxID=2944904 RepID=UPI002022534C|nr:HAD family phosphatase [Sphingobacterium sp. lm-10]MCL7986598.1 HAD family phosphatase [Sphingobacterium sp. lm-10]
MQNIKNIVLDYGNVIFSIDFQRAQQAFSQLGVQNVEDVFAHKQQNEIFDQFDKGLISPAQFREGIRKIANAPHLSDADIDQAWNALLIGVPAGKHEVLTQLKSKYRLFLLSNNNEIHYAYCMQHIQEKYGVESNTVFFEKTYYSHEMGMRKPDRDIFDYVLHDAQINPEETLFIDDSPQHLATAKSLRIHTALCTTEEPLEKIVADWQL